MLRLAFGVAVAAVHGLRIPSIESVARVATYASKEDGVVLLQVRAEPVHKTEPYLADAPWESTGLAHSSYSSLAESGSIAAGITSSGGSLAPSMKETLSSMPGLLSDDAVVVENEEADEAQEEANVAGMTLAVDGTSETARATVASPAETDSASSWARRGGSAGAAGQHAENAGRNRTKNPTGKVVMLWHEGPRIGSSGSQYCFGGRNAVANSMSLTAARATCNMDPSCSFLWSQKCSGRWWTCSSPDVPIENGGDESSCTLLKGKKRTKQQRPAKRTPGADVSDSHRLEKVTDCTSWAGNACDWTSLFNCPGQVVGSEGEAGADHSPGYECCCNQGLWQQWSRFGNGTKDELANAEIGALGDAKVQGNIRKVKLANDAVDTLKETLGQTGEQEVEKVGRRGRRHNGSKKTKKTKAVVLTDTSKQYQHGSLLAERVHHNLAQHGPVEWIADAIMTKMMGRNVSEKEQKELEIEEWNRRSQAHHGRMEQKDAKSRRQEDDNERWKQTHHKANKSSNTTSKYADGHDKEHAAIDN